jgi:hypothetical protein
MVKKEEEKEVKKEEEEKEVSFEKILYEEFKAMDKQIAELQTEATALDVAVLAVTSIIYAPITFDEKTKKPIKPGEFEDSENFRNTLDALHVYLGKSLDYVVRLEKQRGTIFQEQESELPSERKETPSPVNVTFGQQQPPTVPSEPEKFGLFRYLDRKEERKFQEQQLEIQQSQQQPIVATTKIVDVVEFGRQLQPAFNKIKKWLTGTLAEIRHFPDEHIYIVRHEELAMYFGQTVGALVTFVSARIEYRRTLIEGRKLALIRNIARIAEAQSLTPSVQVGGTFASKGFKLSKDGFGEKT